MKFIMGCTTGSIGSSWDELDGLYDVLSRKFFEEMISKTSILKNHKTWRLEREGCGGKQQENRIMC
jgi:hypothetical protein